MALPTEAMQDGAFFTIGKRGNCGVAAVHAVEEGVFNATPAT